jgi:NADPH:quinone reductase-like Zn-dependent oxidoreductase
MSTMRVFQVQDAWSDDNVKLAERPQPQAGPGQVRLHMRVAALNYRDLLVPRKGYGARMKALPLVMLSDGVGVIDQVGAGVDPARIGERVCPLFFQSWQDGEPSEEHLARSLGSETDGTMADWMVLPEAGVAPAPTHLDDVEAATLPTAGVTAWRALVTEAHVRAGDTVLVQGTGGVSLFALQFAKLHGARVICTSSSDEKLARARELGADETINYRTTPEWGRFARQLADGRGVDHVVEVGGQGSLAQSLRAVRPGGSISMIGVLGGPTMDAALGLVVTRHVRLQGITVGSAEDFAAMSRAITGSGMRPVVDRVFAFEELREAMAHLAAGRHFGKVCLHF